MMKIKTEVTEIVTLPWKYYSEIITTVSLFVSSGLLISKNFGMLTKPS